MGVNASGQFLGAFFGGTLGGFLLTLHNTSRLEYPDSNCHNLVIHQFWSGSATLFNFTGFKLARNAGNR